MRWAVVIALIIILVGCRSLVDKVHQGAHLALDQGRSITLEEYVAQERELNEKYLYGSPMEALKALEQLAALEEDYAKNGQKPIDSNHARMLAYSRLFVLSEKLKERPEAEMYLEKAVHFAVEWKPEIGALTEEKKTDFVRHYVDEFEEGLMVRWKTDLK
jgi:hypothetical protein